MMQLTFSRKTVNVVVALILISVVVVAVMMPLWLLTVGQTLMDSDLHIVLPFGRMILSFVAFTVPLVIGVIIAHFKPRIAAVIRKGLRPVLVIVILSTTAVGLYLYSYLFTMLTVAILVAGCCLPYAGFLLGAVLSVVCRQSRMRVLTIAIETGIQNTIISTMVLMNCLPHPELEIALVGPAATGIATPLPLFIAVAGHEIWRRCCRGKAEVAPEDNADDDDGTAGQLRLGDGRTNKIIAPEDKPTV